MSELPARPVNTRDLPTPALVVRQSVFEANVARMSAARPGRSLRPHVKAFKSTALARKLAEAGHDAFCCATPAEVVGSPSLQATGRASAGRWGAVKLVAPLFTDQP